MELAQIRKLSDHELVASLHDVFEKERKISHTALLHIKVIHDRKIYSERGYSSLFEMLIKEFKLSETSANQRLKALELLKVVPDAEKSLINGEVNLTTLALAQRQIAREEKITGEKVSAAKKTEIVDKIKNKTQAETEVELMRLLPNTATSPKTHEKRISEDTIRVSLNMPDRLIEKLKRLQELWAHIDPSMEYIEAIERSVDDTLSRIDPLLKKMRKSDKNSNKDSERVDDSEKNRSAVQCDDQVVEHQAKRPTYYSIHTREILWKKSGACCEYVDEDTGRRCSSRFGLEIDHRIPLAMGGTNDVSNLRLLCQSHNLLMARRWFGDEKIDREIHRDRTLS